MNADAGAALPAEPMTERAPARIIRPHYQPALCDALLELSLRASAGRSLRSIEREAWGQIVASRGAEPQ